MAVKRRALAWPLVLLAIGAAAAIIYISSIRYGLTISFGQRFAVGIVGGAMMLQDRQPPVAVIQPPPGTRVFPGGAPGVLTTAGPSGYKHDAVHFYRHNFGWTWWYQSHGPTVGASSRWAEVPLWMIAAPVGLVAGGWTLHRRLRTPPGHCRFCRYDLRATTTGVCPECGAGIEVARQPDRAPAPRQN